MSKVHWDLDLGMDTEAANLTQATVRNKTSSLCAEPYFTVVFIKNIILLVYIIPTTIVVTTELLKKKYNSRRDPRVTCASSFSYSMSEVFLFHISYINISSAVFQLLNLLQEVGYYQLNYLLLLILSAPGHSAEPVFLTAASMDWYIAVVHPVAYIASKKFQYRGTLLSVAIWAYALVIEVTVYVFDLSLFHPVYMLSSYISLPATLYFNIATLWALHSAGPGRDGKPAALSPEKRKAFRIILGILVMMMIYNVPQAFYMTYRFIEPADLKQVLCFELPLVQAIPTCCEFATPLIYLYSLGKLGI